MKTGGTAQPPAARGAPQEPARGGSKVKRIWKILIAVGVCLVVVAIVFLLSLDSLVKAGVEKGATTVLGADTTLQTAKIGITSGSAELNGLVIANPKDYEPGNFLELGRIDVGLSIGSLLSDTVVVDRIVLESPVLKLKQKGLDSNLRTILRNTGGAGAAAPAAEAKPAQPAAKGKKFKIGLIKITGAKLEYAIGSVPAPPMPLPDIELKDISNADGTPVLFKDVLVQIFSAMAKSAATSLKGILPADVTGALDGAAKLGLEGVGKAVEGAGSVVKGAGEAVKGVGDAVKGIGSLLEKGDKKSE